MLFQQSFLVGIRNGTITLAFRRWRRPTVRSGGTLLTSIGELTISSVSETALDHISSQDATRAGYDSLDALLAELKERHDGRIYRIELGGLRPDPRVALRESQVMTDNDHRSVLQRLTQFDARAAEGPWTFRTLELIDEHPGLRAADLCRFARQDKDQFKLNVRKLKALGLTESLEIGYRLSPRGSAFMRTLRLRHSKDS